MCYFKFPSNTRFTVLGMSGSATDQGFSVGPDVVGSEINRFVDLSGSMYGPVKDFINTATDLQFPKRDSCILTSAGLSASKGLCPVVLVTINTLAQIRKFCSVQ